MDAPDSTDYAVWWLRIALGDLVTAAAILGDLALPPRETAELAQQAAEKALKATIALDGSEPPRTHDLVLLAQRVPVGVRIADLSVDLVALSAAFPSARYPDPLEPLYEHPEALRLHEAAEAILRAVTTHFEAQGVDISALEPR
jgi:HEPN domain-containing protein